MDYWKHFSSGGCEQRSEAVASTSKELEGVGGEAVFGPRCEGCENSHGKECTLPYPGPAPSL